MTQNEPVQPDIDVLIQQCEDNASNGKVSAPTSQEVADAFRAQQATITSQTKYMDTADEVMHKRAMLISKQAEHNENLQSDNDDQQSTITTLQEQVERLRTWLKAVEWVDGPGGYLRCPMCRRRPYIHDPQCNWVEDKAVLGEGK
ncbi:hypothetical protein LCGC14_1382490 [marine sediment metagenome]|uniref:Uncharacterized protein n=1 Tax=marine sediment metagenome TaxID=412755 RepID=A0A0F9N3Y1_9ZZZZ